MQSISRFQQLQVQTKRWIKTLISPKAGVATIGALLLAGGMGAHQMAYANGERAAGTLFGAGVGALAGQRFGGNDGAIVGGAIGAVVGNQLAHSSHRVHRGHRIIIETPGWRGHWRGYRDSRRYYDDRRHRRIERRERRAYRDGYRQGRRDARSRHPGRWESRHRW